MLDLFLAGMGALLVLGSVVWLIVDSGPGQVKIAGKGSNGWSTSTKKSMTRGQARRANLSDCWKPDGLTMQGMTPGHDVEPARQSEGTGFFWGLLSGLVLIGALVLYFS